MDSRTEYALLVSRNNCWPPNVCQALSQALETEVNPPDLEQSPAETVKLDHREKVQGGREALREESTRHLGTRNEFA